MKKFNRLAATVVASTALLMSTGSVAHAQSVTVKDTSSDVVVYTADDTGNGTLLGYQDSVDSGVDVRSLKIKHTKKSVTLTLKLVELDPEATVSVAFKVPGKSQPQWFLARTGRTKAEVYNAKEKKACNVPLTVKNGTKGSIKATIKRSCLKNPKKIKVAAAVATVEFGDNALTVKQDAVSATSVRTPTYTKWIKSS